ncbi:MAG TPA: NRDE family protein [Pseudomonadales bacterium]|nr:NRDE family protein [Pseudomonadales bacterium]
MCLIVFALNAHPEWDLVVAANRDEFYQRPAAIANYWADKPHILGGRDLAARGTWLAVDARGRFAALTNVRHQDRSDMPSSRGELVTHFLDSHHTPEHFHDAIETDLYGGYNLILDDGQYAWYHSNRYPSRALTPGIYGLSNAELNSDWPKVTSSVADFKHALASDNIEEALFSLLQDEAAAEDEHLPDTGVGIALERMLSPRFICTPDYGTRVSTVLLRNRERLIFIERQHMPEGDTVRFELTRQNSGTFG